MITTCIYTMYFWLFCFLYCIFSQIIPPEIFQSRPYWYWNLLGIRYLWWWIEVKILPVHPVQVNLPDFIILKFWVFLGSGFGYFGFGKNIGFVLTQYHYYQASLQKKSEKNNVSKTGLKILLRVFHSFLLASILYLN